MEPRVVMVRRRTEYESLLREHGTAQMAAFRLKQRGLALKDIFQRHEVLIEAADLALSSVPLTWRRSWVLREDLARFLFGPEDIVVAVGLDGLVPNVAKYLKGQPVIGVNPFLEVEQQMMHFSPRALSYLYKYGAPGLQCRSMVQVKLDDGRSLTALNELFCGHCSHQSAKYDISFAGESEYQSSSGVIVTTGTGATGWARSIAEATGMSVGKLPLPTQPQACFLIREAWASSFTGTGLLRGFVSEHKPLEVTSKMQEGGVIFGDGIESDRLSFKWGEKALFRVAKQTLNLVVPNGDAPFLPWDQVFR